ncbi:4-hydroxybenzoate polyprenyltransferase [Archaeoglobus profundus DSM 5631]|uniref:4-hydroxybenzoate polyprenyltransferase n=2 Tax=Archaeoglobus profundus TaxID=84156 RepID=D2RDV9_ARCPA|nr:4-hydroxybenzoate polyprenyltransferase [Archaeoglobus profundus DSM 5631]
MGKLRDYADFVKIEHTLFALPFAYLGAFIAQRGWFGLKLFVLIALAFTGMRTLAMTLNRIIDREIDALNPRTASRHLPSGRMSLKEAYAILLIALIVYEVSAYLINETAFKLSPIPVIVAYIYPYLKRFTCLCHYVLGLNLALAPLGGWVAVTDSVFFDKTILLLSLAVIFWVAGFDIIYALQDLEFDRRYGLHSIGAHFGKKFALRLSALNHFIFFVLVFLSATMWSKLAVIGAVVIGLLLIYEHLAVRRGEIETAFFKVNATISSILLLTFLLTT